MHDAGGDEEDWHAELSRGTVSPAFTAESFPPPGITIAQAFRV